MHTSEFLLNLQGCILIGNISNKNGGVIWNCNTNLVVNNCTAHGNIAVKGRFIFDDGSCCNPPCSGKILLVNSIINNGDNEVWNIYSDVLIKQCNIVEGIFSIYDPCHLAIWDTSNMNKDPYFINPGYWDSNSTPNDPNDDYFIEGDYHLKSQAGHWDTNSETWIQDEVTSPCIDTGNPNSPIMYEPFPNV